MSGRGERMRSMEMRIAAATRAAECGWPEAEATAQAGARQWDGASQEWRRRRVASAVVALPALLALCGTLLFECGPVFAATSVSQQSIAPPYATDANGNILGGTAAN